MFVGVGASRVRDLFKKVRSNVNPPQQYLSTNIDPLDPHLP